MRIKEKIIKIFNKIFKRNSPLMLQNGLDKNLENIDMNEMWKSESIGRNNDFEDEVYEIRKALTDRNFFRERATRLYGVTRAELDY